MESHYTWLEVNFPTVLKNLGLDEHIKYVNSIISADGDKCYCYQHKWKLNNIPFSHGVALYLLTNIPPYDAEVRQTKNGWISPDNWVINNYDKFKQYLPK